MLKIQNLSKTYSNGVKALNDVSLEIPKGLFGLLGPNGAGKSTLMRTIATLQEADSGSIELNGLDVINDKMGVKRNLGYLPQEFGFHPKETAFSFLNHFCMLKGITDKSSRQELVESLLQRVNLWDARKQRLGTFSGGMKQRLGIAQALIGNPGLIIVDEPTAGLDPEERVRFHNLLSEIGENVVVLLSTHIVDDVSDLCPQMAIINKGEIVFTGNTGEAIDVMKAQIWEKPIEKTSLDEYRSRYHILSTRLFAGRHYIRIFQAESPGGDFIPVDAKLEDVYFKHLERGINNPVAG
ncbi:ABC transporter ATP-binding protein [bacterium]|nr:ABC transporter ATP-binding protein [bacterium]